MIKATLCFVFQDHTRQVILLGRKKRGFAQGKIDGFGGKLEAGESLAEAAARELHEETGLIATSADLLSLGVVTFIFPHKPSWDQEVHVFEALKWQGVPGESEEMRPEWFSLEDIPYDLMWDDSKYWLPYVLAGKRISARFTYSDDNETVCNYSIQQL
jgi:8-oxo-dGTP diphosphatase